MRVDLVYVGTENDVGVVHGFKGAEVGAEVRALVVFGLGFEGLA